MPLDDAAADEVVREIAARIDNFPLAASGLGVVGVDALIHSGRRRHARHALDQLARHVAERDERAQAPELSGLEGDLVAAEAPDAAATAYPQRSTRRAPSRR